MYLHRRCESLDSDRSHCPVRLQFVRQVCSCGTFGHSGILLTLSQMFYYRRDFAWWSIGSSPLTRSKASVSTPRPHFAARTTDRPLCIGHYRPQPPIAHGAGAFGSGVARLCGGSHESPTTKFSCSTMTNAVSILEYIGHLLGTAPTGHQRRKMSHNRCVRLTIAWPSRYNGEQELVT